jgi:hypothetical protein
MIWAFNTQALALALALAQVAIKRGLAMPKDFKATVEIFICREVAYWSLAQQKAGNSPQPYLDQVFNQSRQWAKPDQIEARLLKAKGQDIQQVNPNEALTLYKRAQTLDADCGVSHLIKRVQKQLQG